MVRPSAPILGAHWGASGDSGAQGLRPICSHGERASQVWAGPTAAQDRDTRTSRVGAHRGLCKQGAHTEEHLSHFPRPCPPPKPLPIHTVGSQWGSPAQKEPQGQGKPELPWTGCPVGVGTEQPFPLPRLITQQPCSDLSQACSPLTPVPGDLAEGITETSETTPKSPPS